MAVGSAAPVESAGRYRLAESPRWIGARWWWVDVPAGVVLSADPAPDGWSVDRWDLASDRVAFVLPLRPGASPEPNTDDAVAIVGRGTELVFLKRDPAQPPIPVGRIAVPDGFVLNDAVGDGDRRWWVGLVDAQGSTAGSLVRVDATGSVHERIEGFTMSNGVAVAADGSLLHADSGTGIVWRHRFRDDGAVDSSTPVLQIPADEGMPDGLCTDRAGGFWLAVYGAGQVRHYRDDGTQDAVVEVPTAQTTSVALGGPDGHDLLITTAREGFTAARSAAEPLSGMLFTARSETPGAP